MLKAMATTPALMSFAEFEQLPDTAEELELLKGELIRLPPAQRPHMKISEIVYKALTAWREVHPEAAVGDIHIEMGYLISSDPKSWLRPDVSITHPNQPGERYYEGAPLIVFEVVSEYDRAKQLLAKVATYFENGSTEVWVLDAALPGAWVYRPGGHATLETKSIHSDFLPGLEISFSEIF